MAFNEEQFIRDMLGATGGKVTIEKGILNKSFDEMKEDLEKVFKPRETIFTLTAEEVENIKEPIQYFANRLNKGWLMEEGGAYIPPYSWEKAINNLINKIKDYQNDK